METNIVKTTRFTTYYENNESFVLDDFCDVVIVVRLLREPAILFNLFNMRCLCSLTYRCFVVVNYMLQCHCVSEFLFFMIFIFFQFFFIYHNIVSVFMLKMCIFLISALLTEIE